jgi:hypothetical protein
MHEPIHLEDLRALYRAAFEEWASSAGRLEQVRDSVLQDRVLEDAQFRTAEAETSYREVRNRLADEMVADRTSAESDRNMKTRVRIEGMGDSSLKEFFETCEQFCASAIRRGGQPPVFFAFRRQLAAAEMTRRTTPYV